MANIPTYDAPPGLGLQPTETGISARERAGRHIDDAWNRAGADLGNAISTVGKQFGDYEAHREIAQGAATLAAVHDDLTKSWEEMAKDPANRDNPALAEKFRSEVLEPKLQKFKDSFGNEKASLWAEGRIEKFREHMWTKTRADASTLAGQTVASNMTDLRNRTANMVYGDPSSIEAAFDLVDNSMKAIAATANLSPADAQKAGSDGVKALKETLARAYFIGAARKNPDAAMQELEAGKFGELISPEDRKKIVTEIRTQQRAERLDRVNSKHLENEQKQAASDAAESGIIKDLYSGDPNRVAKVMPTAISQNDDLKPSLKRTLINLVERETKPETEKKLSERNYLSILADIRSGKISDTEAIHDARIDGRLSKDDYRQALTDFVEFKSTSGEALSKDRAEFFKRYEGTIDTDFGQGGVRSALGGRRMYMAEKDARRMEEELRKAGKDPHDLYDPASPDFLGAPKKLSKYKFSLQDEQRYLSEQNRAAPGPITAERIHGAIIGQESGGNPNVRTSVDGAQGIGQIVPATFAQYARPGESISNPADNLEVSKRIIDDYYKRYNGDAARVAVAYHSGPGNVAPAGSPTPYIRNTVDGLGKHTADYVNDVMKRLGGGGQGGGIVDIPKDMSPADAIKIFKLQSGQRVRLPDGTFGRVP